MRAGRGGGNQVGGGPRRPASAARHPWVVRLAPYRYLITAVLDGLAWYVALAYSSWLRYEFDVSLIDFGQVAVLGTVAAAVQIGFGRSQGLYSGRWRFGSFEEVANLVATVVVTTVVAFTVNQIPGQHFVPSGAVLGSALVALVLMSGARYGWRLFLETLRRPSDDRARRTIIYGAGAAAHQLVRSMITTPTSPFLPVAALDDDPHKREHRLARTVRVEGTGADLARVADEHKAKVVVLAVATADSDLVQRVVASGEAAGLDVRILPTLLELADEDHIGLGDVRPVTIADLLGRHEADLDVAAIAGYLEDKRVLVTGAGGSIGSELCRQISVFGPGELVMLDRDESALHALQLSLDAQGHVDDERLVVADIRDRERLHEVFGRFQPDVVFHAAALKHVPLLERNPEEALKTNVWGTRNVLEAAEKAGVGHLINISTDKAADPVNVLGRSKLLAECITAGVAEVTDGAFVSVRFGNVLGSRGSVLTTFEHQVANGGPVTVTHPDVTRFFMTVEEAVQLVIQAGAIGRDGDVLVLDMGEPVRIADVARRLADSVEPPVEITFTGLRPGEKLTEVLFGEGEAPQPTEHPLITRVAGRPVRPDDLPSLWDPSLGAADAMQACVERLRTSGLSEGVSNGVGSSGQGAGRVSSVSAARAARSNR